MTNLATKTRNDCCRRISNREEILQQEGVNVEKLMSNVENYIDNLSALTSVDLDDLNSFVQSVEKALPDQVEFIEQFRSCVYGLYDHMMAHTRHT